MRKALSAVTVFCLLGACVSCSNSAERDTSRKAVLDYSKNYIHLPLDEYAFDELTIRTVSTAWHTLMSECYAHHGQSYAVPSIDTPQPGGAIRQLERRVRQKVRVLPEGIPRPRRFSTRRHQHPVPRRGENRIL